MQNDVDRAILNEIRAARAGGAPAAASSGSAKGSASASATHQVGEATVKLIVKAGSDATAKAPAGSVPQAAAGSTAQAEAHITDGNGEKKVVRAVVDTSALAKAKMPAPMKITPRNVANLSAGMRLRFVLPLSIFVLTCVLVFFPAQKRDLFVQVLRELDSRIGSMEKTLKLPSLPSLKLRKLRTFKALLPTEKLQEQQMKDFAKPGLPLAPNPSGSFFLSSTVAFQALIVLNLLC